MYQNLMQLAQYAPVINFLEVYRNSEEKTRQGFS